MTNCEVFAVPGNVTSRNSFGTNYLIKGAGAKLVQTWQDVVSELGEEIARELLPPELSKDADTTKGNSANSSAKMNAPADLSEVEQAIWIHLTADATMHMIIRPVKIYRPPAAVRRWFPGWPVRQCPMKPAAQVEPSHPARPPG